MLLNFFFILNVFETLWNFSATIIIYNHSKNHYSLFHRLFCSKCTILLKHSYQPKTHFLNFNFNYNEISSLLMKFFKFLKTILEQQHLPRPTTQRPTHKSPTRKMEQLKRQDGESSVYTKSTIEWWKHCRNLYSNWDFLYSYGFDLQTRNRMKLSLFINNSNKTTLFSLWWLEGRLKDSHKNS